METLGHAPNGDTPRGVSPRRSALRLAGLALVLLAVAGCGRESNKDKLDGPLGPGAGGQAVLLPGTGLPLTRPDGVQNGSLSYDSLYFTFTAAPPPPANTISPNFGAFADKNLDGIQILVTHISGRADTPCRFSAALLARDSGFTVGDTGFRTNGAGQKLYQVNVSGPGAAGRLFCAELQSKTGMQFAVLAPTPDKLEYLQVHFLLNSITP
jgi:hypothetical protein